MEKRYGGQENEYKKRQGIKKRRTTDTDWFEELIKTIENNSVDNKATITNVELWAKSWREERDLFENHVCECGANKRIAKDCTIKPCKY